MALADLTAFISEAKKRTFSLIPTVPESDIKSIWNSTSKFIKNTLLSHKGVQIPGFGTLSFAESRAAAGHKILQIHRPILTLSESFMRSHGLSQTKIFPSGSTPTVQLNYTAISNGTTFSHDAVEFTIKEIFLSLSYCLSQQRNIQLEFPDIGRMLIREKKVKMQFYLDFIRQLDRDGELEQYFRPCTSISEAPPSAAMVQSSNAARRNTAPLPTLEKSMRITASKPASSGANHVNPEDKIEQQANSDSKDKSAGTVLPRIPTATLISSLDKEEHSKSPPLGNGRKSKSVPSRSTTRRQERDMCYVCDQRDKRNIFIDFTAEKRRRQKEYDDMMWDYQRKKKEMGDLKDCLARRVSREYSRQQANFNWSVANEKKIQKHQRSAFHPSYLLDQRPVTAPKQLERAEYCKELNSQIKAIQHRLEEVEEQKKKAEEEYQKELAQSLAAMQAAYYEQKAEEVAKYRKVLAVQVKAKHEKMNEIESTTTQKFPVFGVDKLHKERGEWDNELKQYNLEAAERKLRKSQQRAMEETREGEEMLKRAKEALIGDLLAARHMRIMDRKRLHDSWAFTAEHRKKQADLERQYSKEPCLRLLQQCDRYRRCSQCQRRKYADVSKNVDKDFAKPRPEEVYV